MRISDWSSDVCSSDLQTSAEPATVQPLGASVIAPMRYTVSPAASSASVTDEAWLSATTTAMPTPQLKVRAISSGSIFPCDWRQALRRGGGQRHASTWGLGRASGGGRGGQHV